MAVASQPSDRALNDETYTLYVEALSDLDEKQIARGFSLALYQDPGQYFPSIQRVRELAGVPSEADLARDALAWLFSYVRRYGVDGQARKAVRKDEPGEDGRPRSVLVKPLEYPPDIPDLLHRTLVLLGTGDIHNGLEFISTHPGLTSWSPEGGMEPVWVAERIEGKFFHAFHRARLGHGATAEEEGRGKVRAMRASSGS